ncbi:amidohydrolase [Gordonia sp. HY002]|uniref:amidohydrolase n=1 Tax=Gordonia zhenghanii TaxID=2911516 RepID=UPI001EEFE132|nr:amidohydrolase [Gordonia zhenghanii]MCF8570529.1 amidohydrolase [Gordonia zhenghanii]MCF8602514.1 amidohydrolase [Gordonia zhenghanii]
MLPVISDWLDANLDRAIGWRRELHASPELSMQETKTTATVVRILTEAGLSPRVLPKGTGVVCDLGPTDKPRIGLRADLDGLPVPEQTGLPFASRNEGVSHSCGHDAHSAILLGVGTLLAEIDRGAGLPFGVRLLFQAAEEVMPGGALDAIDAGVADGLSRIFALHCEPHIQVGSVGLRAGPLTSAADRVEVHLHGPGGHSSRPHLTNDLVYAMGAIVTGVAGVLSRRVDPRSGTVVTWGAVHAGNAPNAIPQEGRMRGTVRTGDRDTWQLLEPLVRSVIGEIAAPLGVACDITYFRGVPPVVNDADSVALMRRSVEALGPGADVDTPQSAGGEDFAWYLERVPGAMARLGVWSGTGPMCDLHQPNFDIDERAIGIGIAVMAGVALGV